MNNESFIWLVCSLMLIMTIPKCVNIFFDGKISKQWRKISDKLDLDSLFSGLFFLLAGALIGYLSWEYIELQKAKYFIFPFAFLYIIIGAIWTSIWLAVVLIELLIFIVKISMRCVIKLSQKTGFGGDKKG
ncbi:hypothetical protein acsn021_10890 [Anaerocolumna cellulosilytica]|uniref:Uncharacterized protein n=1 Tax=Anaerocolumna cellulosilytica TaxID=433286 RepID=A0A6S6R2H7_9FIRM|nr:hypothetical protein [Anaerocolumna cellulosilytica]MBB5194576.1 hypothetical protein [Anaerocolumna cellulosilytica]BCJ93520.1 hypothetical protein acsn021_10890 [Anaerocolumna cellulosilytica]